MSHLGATADQSIGDTPRNATLVVAIDFGTTFSGYAFSFQSNREDIRMFKDWGACVGIPVAFKAPTCVLTDIDDRFIAFGYEAQNRYSNVLPEEAVNYHFYERFKMRLHAKKLRSDSTITSNSGKVTKALNIFSMVLNYLKNHVSKTIKTQTGSAPSDDDIRWVVTVPAIWSDASKQFMREAAHKASLTRFPESHQLIIALEPEAASLYCRLMDLHMSGETGWQTKISTGSEYLVLDCGGGTLDITVHKLNEDNTISEVYIANGGDLGGTKVDEEFIRLLEDIFGKQMLSTLRVECPADWLQTLINFERVKKTVDSENRDQSINLPLSYGFVECYQEVTGRKIRSLDHNGVKFNSGMLRIPPHIMSKLFNPVKQGIVSRVNDLLQHPSLRKVSLVLLVGGFGESKILEDAIYGICRTKGLKVLTPSEASLCVMKGAVLYGHAPCDVAERIARKTYGYRRSPRYDANIHSDPNKTVMISGIKRAHPVFDKWISKGKAIKSCQKITSSVFPASGAQKRVSFHIYESHKSNPEYTDEDGVEEVGTVTIDLPGHGRDRQVKYSIMFGGTEMEVEAWDPRPGGDRQSCKVDFLSC